MGTLQIRCAVFYCCFLCGAKALELVFYIVQINGTPLKCTGDAGAGVDALACGLVGSLCNHMAGRVIKP